MLKKYLISFLIILQISIFSFGNTIDTITTNEGAFSLFKKFYSWNTSSMSINDSENNFGYLYFHPYYKADLNEDGLTDMIINIKSSNHYDSYALVSIENTFHLIHLNVNHRYKENIAFVKPESPEIIYLIQFQTGKNSGFQLLNHQRLRIIDTYLIDYNPNPVDKKIKSIEISISAFGVESDYFPSVFCSINYEKNESVFTESYYNPALKGKKTTMTISEMNVIKKIISYCDLNSLNVWDKTTISDQATGIIKVNYNDTFFQVEDYGLDGSLTAQTLFILLLNKTTDYSKK